MRANPHSRGFTLVELMVSMGLAAVVMIAVFSTYLYLGRNLMRLSYRSLLEGQSRKILHLLASDIRNAKSIISATDLSLNLTVYNQDPTKGTVPTMTVSYLFSTTGLYADKITRNSIPIVTNINDSSSQVTVSLLLPADGKLFRYSTSTGNTYTSTGTGPTYQATTTLVPISIKQVTTNFTLQAGNASVQGLQGTLTTYPVSSGRMLLVNHQFPDGS